MMSSGRQDRAGRFVGPGRAPDRRALRRCRYRPRAAARYGLNIADVQAVVSGAIGGENVGETVEGLARYPISLRYPRELARQPRRAAHCRSSRRRASRSRWAPWPIVSITEGPPMLKSENARPSTGSMSTCADATSPRWSATCAQRAVAKQVRLSPGVSIAYSGQFEYLQRAERAQAGRARDSADHLRSALHDLRRFDEAALIMGTLPFALTGGIWFLYLLAIILSVATGVGFIALAGVSAEFGVVMLLYLKHAYEDRGPAPDAAQVETAVREGALLRVRPKAMTVAVILAGLLPILLGSGAGSEVMSRIAAPMIGGMLTAPLLSMFVLPAAYLLLRRPKTKPIPQPV
jgi:Cu(I)/Ag(I) efflux system membrane protein CusA/SilA